MVETTVLPLHGRDSASLDLPNGAMGRDNPGTLTPTELLWGKKGFLKLLLIGQMHAQFIVHIMHLEIIQMTLVYQYACFIVAEIATE